MPFDVGYERGGCAYHHFQSHLPERLALRVDPGGGHPPPPSAFSITKLNA